jgi:hypothetical protein
VFGIKFDSVITRGSQHRVESMMARLTRPMGYLLTALTRKQVGEQAAMEAMPLILEPQSKFFTSPVVCFFFVLPFLAVYWLSSSSSHFPTLFLVVLFWIRPFLIFNPCTPRWSSPITCAIQLAWVAFLLLSPLSPTPLLLPLPPTA